MAKKRLEVLAGIPLLDIPPAVNLLSKQLITTGPLPAKAETDAIHISVAATNGIDFLLTWNCKHIANAQMQRAIREICKAAGFDSPVICTPWDLLGDEANVEG